MMYELNFKKRVGIVKQRLKGVSPSKLALAQKVSERTIRKIYANYKEEGWDSLKNHKTGRPETNLSKNAEIIIFDMTSSPT